tara:strand:- start:228 stop:449 length:222 start_codon:yes stop_codon:yes gene_type:complete
MNKQFNDYPSDQIQAKLKQVTEFEAKYGESTRTKAWKKWCTDTKYRQNEWQFRQNIANSIQNTTLRLSIDRLT